jgi:hypothetical protein
MATIPSLALIPSGYKASKVYSVLPTDGSGDFDFYKKWKCNKIEFRWFNRISFKLTFQDLTIL